MTSHRYYFDHAAATPLDEMALVAMQPFFSENFFNPSSAYAPAVHVRRQYDEAKQKIAQVLGVSRDELVMTAGATESLAMVVAGQTGHIVTSAIEHTALLSAAKKRDAHIVPVSSKGEVDPLAVQAAITPHTTLVTIGLANSELGTLQRMRDIAAVVQYERTQRRDAGDATPIFLHTDASQGAGLVDIMPSRLGVDAMTLNSAKVYGPKQVGLLWMTRSMEIKPFIEGGGQEHGLRGGTENVAGVVGFAEALYMAQHRRKSESVRLAAMRDYLQKRIAESCPDAVFSGNQKRRLPNYLHVAFPGLDAERLIFMLEAQGVYVATGSACAANKGTRSHVLEAIGLPPSTADGSLRITLGKCNEQQDMEMAATIIIETVMKEKRRVRL